MLLGIGVDLRQSIRAHVVTVDASIHVLSHPLVVSVSGLVNFFATQGIVLVCDQIFNVLVLVAFPKLNLAILVFVERTRSFLSSLD